MDTTIDFKAKEEVPFLKRAGNDMKEIVDMMIAECFDQHGHGDEPAAKVLLEMYEEANNKELERIIISIIIESFASKGYWHQAVELGERLNHIRNLLFKKEMRRFLTHYQHLTGAHWTDDYGVMHGELIVKI